MLGIFTNTRLLGLFRSWYGSARIFCANTYTGQKAIPQVINGKLEMYLSWETHRIAINIDNNPPRLPWAPVDAAPRPVNSATMAVAVIFDHRLGSETESLALNHVPFQTFFQLCRKANLTGVNMFYWAEDGKRISYQTKAFQRWFLRNPHFAKSHRSCVLRFCPRHRCAWALVVGVG